MALIDHGLMDYMQFTWRLLMLAVVLLALAAGYGVARFFEEKPEHGVLLTLCLASAMALPTLTTETQSDDYLRYGETYPRICMARNTRWKGRISPIRATKTRMSSGAKST
ncbi:MAG: hypothetical protein ACLR07_09070 [Christensenellales bacterium]